MWAPVPARLGNPPDPHVYIAPFDHRGGVKRDRENHKKKNNRKHRKKIGEERKGIREEWNKRM